MHLAGLDLNLLVALEALLREQNVTRAARSVGLSQSAMSHALGRLRELLGDPLLVRNKTGMAPTPRAEALQVPLATALSLVRQVLAQGPGFDGKTATRTFRVASGDLAELVLLPGLFERWATESPGCAILAPPPTDDLGGMLERAEIELAMTPVRKLEAGQQEAPLFEETFVCAMSTSHPLAKRRLTLAAFASARHAVIAPRGVRGGIVDDALRELGKERAIPLQLPHFLVAPFVVARSDLIITLPTRVARLLEKPLGLTLQKPPLELPGFTMSMLWHERSNRDPGHRFLRDELAWVAKRLSAA